MSKPDRNAASLGRRAFLAAGAGSLSLGAAPAGPVPAPANPRLFSFVGGDSGAWAVTEFRAVAGEPLPRVKRVEILNADALALPAGAAWVLRGVTANERYTTRAEKAQLVAKQKPLGRPEATHAALIPIRKSAAWWALTQDERLSLFSAKSGHTERGLRYLPAVARRLHHCRDLATAEPFDFVTLFDYAPEGAAAFDEMLAGYRASPEWQYVERELDIRLVKA